MPGDGVRPTSGFPQRPRRPDRSGLNAILRGNRDDPAKHVHVRAEVDTERLVLEVGDEGDGFDFDASLIDPTSPENLDREDGRGLFLMRKLMDTVERIDVPHGSKVRMTLHRAS